jgi:hypothetical protein
MQGETMTDRTDECASPWRKSSFSGGGNQCVEVAGLRNGQVGVRDSKNRDGGILRVSTTAWATFVTSVKDEGPHSPSST